MQRRPPTGFCGLVVSVGLALAWLFASALGTPPAALAAGSWSAPTLINPLIGPVLVRSGPERGSLNGAGRIELYSLSCASETFCVAVGGENESRGHGKAPREYERGYLFTYNGHSWRGPLRIPGQLKLSLVSCESNSFCLAIGAHFVSLEKGLEYALTYNGHSWSKPQHIATGEELATLSCASASFCIAGGETSTLIYNASAWSAPQSLGARLPLDSASCASATFCVAVGAVLANQGVVGEGLSEAQREHFESYARTYDGSTWSAPQTIDLIQHQLAAISCPAMTLCLAVDRQGDGLTYNGSAWSAPALIDSQGELSSLFCPSTSFCVGVGNRGEERGEALTYDGSAWSTPEVIDPRHGLVHVSCPSASFCVALDEWGRALFYPGERGAKGALRKARRAARPPAGGQRRLRRARLGVDRAQRRPTRLPGAQPGRSALAGLRAQQERVRGHPDRVGEGGPSGSFSARAAIPTQRRAGLYTVSGRCGGGNLGVLAKLRVLSRGK